LSIISSRIGHFRVLISPRRAQHGKAATKNTSTTDFTDFKDKKNPFPVREILEGMSFLWVVLEKFRKQVAGWTETV
jgi:hypothetical protein